MKKLDKLLSVSNDDLARFIVVAAGGIEPDKDHLLRLISWCPHDRPPQLARAKHFRDAQNAARWMLRERRDARSVIVHDRLVSPAQAAWLESTTVTASPAWSSN